MLERKLNIQLLDRRRFSRRIVFTEAGRRLFDYAERLLALAEEVKAEIASPKAGAILSKVENGA